jgi:hypothetical protein
MIWSFDPVTPASGEQFFSAVMDRAPAAEELQFLLDPEQTEDWYRRSLVWSQPWRKDWPTLGLYTACHGRQLIRYWNEWYPDPPEINVWNITSWRLAERKASLQDQPFLQSLWRQTDYYVTHDFPTADPTLTRFGDRLGAFIEKRRLRMHSPALCSLFPIADIPQDQENVRQLLRQGIPTRQIVQRFRTGQFDPMFRSRHAAAMQRMLRKDARSHVKIEPFVRAHLQREKLFWLISHPTIFLVARIGADILSELFGQRRLSDDEVFSLPLTGCMMKPVWPETPYEWNFHKFKYPRRWKAGAAEFYSKMIEQVSQAEGFTPCDF